VTGSPPLIVVAGATATGKTELGIRLAETYLAAGRRAVIISADSRQVYRGLDIGTAKVGEPDRARVEHRGLDLVDPDQPFSVADFVAHAREVLAGVAADDGVALLVGGTGLYLRAVGHGLDTTRLPHDPVIRARLEAQRLVEGLPSLVERLRGLAPGRAAAIDLDNPRRVVRALEIAEIQGDAPLPERRGYPGPIAWIGLTVAPDRHRAWIAERARTQFESGLLDEADRLRRRFDPGLPAFSAIGYREAWAVLDGTLTLDAAIDLDARRNVAFARRQRTWFRSEPDIAWLDAEEPGLVAAARTLAGRATGE
jgi:tRNA dimethylallyltransferase